MNATRNELIIKMHAEGKSFTEIGLIFNITRQRAHQICSDKFKSKIRRKYKSVLLSTESLDSKLGKE